MVDLPWFCLMPHKRGFNGCHTFSGGWRCTFHCLTNHLRFSKTPKGQNTFLEELASCFSRELLRTTPPGSGERELAKRLRTPREGNRLLPLQVNRNKGTRCNGPVPFLFCLYHKFFYYPLCVLLALQFPIFPVSICPEAVHKSIH